MSVRIVADDPIAEPENRVHSEIIPERLLDLGLRHRGITVFMEETGFCGEEQTGAVHVDRAALKHHLFFETTEPELCGDLWRDRVILVEWRIFSAPRVVVPIRHCHFARLVVLREDRT